MRGDLVWVALQRYPDLRLTEEQVHAWAKRARSQKSFPDIFRDLFERMSKKSPQNMQIAAKDIVFEILKQENDIPQDAQLAQMQWHAKGGVKTLVKIVYKVRGKLHGRALNVPLPENEKHLKKEARNRLKMIRRMGPILHNALVQGIQVLQDKRNRTSQEEETLLRMKRELREKQFRLRAFLKVPLDASTVAKGYYVTAFLVGETLIEEFDRAFRWAHKDADPLDEDSYYALQNRFAEENPALIYEITKNMFHAYWTFLKDTRMTLLPGDIHPGNIMKMLILPHTGETDSGLIDFGQMGFPSVKDGIDYPRDAAGSVYQVITLYLEQDRKKGSSPKLTNMEFASSMPSKLNFHKIFQPTGGEKMLANPMAMDAFIESISDAFGEDVRRKVYERLKDEKPVSGSPMAVFRAHLAPYYEKPVVDIKRGMIKGNAGDLRDALLQRQQAMEDLMALAMEDERFSGRDLQKIRAWKDSDLRAFITEGIPAILKKLGTPPGEEDAWSLTEFERSLDAFGSRMRLEELDLLPGERRNLVELSMGFGKRDGERKRVLKDMFVLMRQLRYSDPQRMGKMFLEEYFQPTGFLKCRDAGMPLDPKSFYFLSDLAGEGRLARMAARARHVFNGMMATSPTVREQHAFSHFTGESISARKRAATLLLDKALKRNQGVSRENFAAFQDMMRRESGDLGRIVEIEGRRDSFLKANAESLLEAMRLAQDAFVADIPAEGLKLPVQGVGGDMHVVFVSREDLDREAGTLTNSYKGFVDNKRYIFIARDLLQEDPHILLQVFVHELLENQIAPRVTKRVNIFSHTILRGYEALFNKDPGRRALGQVSDVMRLDLQRGGNLYAYKLSKPGRTAWVRGYEIPQKKNLRWITQEQANSWVPILAWNLEGEALDHYMKGRQGGPRSNGLGIDRRLAELAL